MQQYGSRCNYDTVILGKQIPVQSKDFYVYIRNLPSSYESYDSKTYHSNIRIMYSTDSTSGSSRIITPLTFSVKQFVESRGKTINGLYCGNGYIRFNPVDAGIFSEDKILSTVTIYAIIVLSMSSSKVSAGSSPYLYNQETLKFTHRPLLSEPNSVFSNIKLKSNSSNTFSSVYTGDLLLNLDNPSSWSEYDVLPTASHYIDVQANGKSIIEDAEFNHSDPNAQTNSINLLSSSSKLLSVISGYQGPTEIKLSYRWKVNRSEKSSVSTPRKHYSPWSSDISVTYVPYPNQYYAPSPSDYSEAYGNNAKITITTTIGKSASSSPAKVGDNITLTIPSWNKPGVYGVADKFLLLRYDDEHVLQAVYPYDINTTQVNLEVKSYWTTRTTFSVRYINTRALDQWVDLPYTTSIPVLYTEDYQKVPILKVYPVKGDRCYSARPHLGFTIPSDISADLSRLNFRVKYVSVRLRLSDLIGYDSDSSTKVIDGSEFRVDNVSSSDTYGPNQIFVYDADEGTQYDNNNWYYMNSLFLPSGESTTHIVSSSYKYIKTMDSEHAMTYKHPEDIPMDLTYSSTNKSGQGYFLIQIATQDDQWSQSRELRIPMSYVNWKLTTGNPGSIIELSDLVDLNRKVSYLHDSYYGIHNPPSLILAGETSSDSDIVSAIKDYLNKVNSSLRVKSITDYIKFPILCDVLYSAQLLKLFSDTEINILMTDPTREYSSSRSIYGNNDSQSSSGIVVDGYTTIPRLNMGFSKYGIIRYLYNIVKWMN